MSTSDRVRAPRVDAARNRAALLDAARRTLRLDPNASIDTIAAAAGLSRRALYGHFASREELVTEIATDGARRIAAAVAALHDDDPVVDLALVGRLIWDDVESIRAMSQSVVRGPLRHVVLGDPFAPLHARVVDDVTRAAAAGTGRTDLPAEIVARLVEGAAFTVLDESIRYPLDRAEGRRLVILAGLGALGLSWREAGAVLDTHHDRLLQEDPPMTTLELLDVRIGDERTPALAPFSTILRPERPTLAAAEGERGPMLASLIAAGRLVPDHGQVLLDGRTDPDALRSAVALVDTPVVAEPAPSLPVRLVVREELRFAGRRSGRRDAESLLTELGLEAWSRAPMLDLPPTDRVRLLLELASLRDGVRALVLTSPERHGGHASGWRRLADEFTARGLPVLVIGGAAVTESTAQAAAPTTLTSGSIR